LATNSLAFEVLRKSSENLFIAGQIYHQKVIDFNKIIYDNLNVSHQFSHNVLPFNITAHMR